MPIPVLVDGQPAAVAPTDRGLAFGDGVFRTLAIRAGRALNWRWHWRRLAADCEALGLALPEEALLLAELRQVAPADAVAKIIVTRGAATRGYRIDRGRRGGTRIVAAFPAMAHDPAAARDGVRVRRCGLVLSQQPLLAGIKHLNRLENVLARSEWDDAAIAEGLLADAEGHVIEGTMSNVFMARGGRLATPLLSRCGVVGAQRERVRELLAADGIACEERDIPWAEMEEAEEIFLTNSLIGVWPVARLQERVLAVGALARRAQALVAQDDARA